MDITTQAVAETAPIHLKNAHGDFMYDEKKRPVRIVLFGPGSAQYAEVEARQTNRAVRRMQENDGKVTVASAEQREAEQAADLAAVTSAFENFTYPPAGDKQGTALFEALYADKSLGFITQQALKAVRDWGNFKSSSATS